MKSIFSHFLIDNAKLINLCPKTNLLSLTLNAQRLTHSQTDAKPYALGITL
jgi:hypothetical protein